MSTVTFSGINLDNSIAINNVPRITTNENQEFLEKNSEAVVTAPINIFTPIKNSIKLIPYFKKRNIVMIWRNAKKSDMSPITAKTLEVIAKNCSCEPVNALPFPSIITPIIAGIESSAKIISVVPIIKRVKNIWVICLLPSILVNK